METLDTVEVTLKLTPKDPWSDVLIAELSERGFDSFVSTDEGIMAYAPASLNLEEALKDSSLHTANSNEFSYEMEQRIIPHQNWNANWEADFHPVHVEEYATILAPFHSEAEVKGMKVEIQPQMSFGTGHHQTTWMMTKALFELEKIPAKVLDMGTGTGVLAIVAEKLGAEEILAIDIEEWSAENAKENADRNDCGKITCLCGDIEDIEGKEFGLIIANINKNVLKSHMQQYVNALSNGGRILLSGFFATDVPELVTFCGELGLTKEKEFNRDEWAGLQLLKK